MQQSAYGLLSLPPHGTQSSKTPSPHTYNVTPPSGYSWAGEIPEVFFLYQSAEEVYPLLVPPHGTLQEMGAGADASVLPVQPGN